MKATVDKTYLFEQMPVKQAVLKQILPSIASQMVVLLYNLADTYFVGMLNDPRQTAAVTVVSFAFTLMTAIANLFGVGGASRIAQSLGKHDPVAAKQISSIAIWFGLAVSVLFSMLFRVLASPVLRICGATEDTYRIAFDYAKWVIIVGGPGTILNVLLSNLVRAEGNALVASVGVSLGGVLNIILDPFFILPQFLNMEAGGAGLATAVSNYAGTIFLFCCIFSKRRTSVLRMDLKHLRRTGTHIGSIMKIGIPSAVQYALTVVAVVALMKFTSGYSTEALAALGIVRKLDLLPLYFAIGTANGMLPLLSYNFASGDRHRRRKVFSFGAKVSLGFSVLCLLCYELFAPALIGLFINDPATIAYGSRFLRIMVVAMPMMSVCYPMIIQFQSMGRVKESLICSIIRKGVIDIPILFLMNMLIPLYGCVMVQPIVDFIAMIVALYFYKKISDEENLKLSDAEHQQTTI